MKFGKDGVPLIILSHRKREFLETALASIRHNAHGISDVIVVDDSGDRDHHHWLDDHGYQYSLSSPDASNVGYLGAMQTVWETARSLDSDSDYVMLWEEDFHLVKPLIVPDMIKVMDENEMLAHLNLQRQSVYRIEKRYGYMESHQQRRYGLHRLNSAGVPWVSRQRPFTTNPGLIRREVLGIDWPTRYECDFIDGGAEPAMSLRLEAEDWYFGWLGNWNTPHTRHVGKQIKTGHGY